MISNMQLHEMRITNIHAKIDEIMNYMNVNDKTKIVYLEKIIQKIKDKNNVK